MCTIKKELKNIVLSELPKQYRNCLLLGIARFIQVETEGVKNYSNCQLLEMASRLVYTTRQNDDGSYLAKPNEHFKDFFSKTGLIKISKKQYASIDDSLFLASKFKGALILFLPSLESDQGHAEFFTGDMLSNPLALSLLKAEKHELMMIFITSKKK